ncbi:MAG: hypothetical protein QM762_26175 [Chryseolinea sp.]
MDDFTIIDLIMIPREVLADAIDFLRSAGIGGIEAIVLFGGEQNDSRYQVKQLLIPVQKTCNTARGSMFHVGSDELSMIDSWLIENKLSLFCQMCSYQGDASESTAEDQYCIVTSAGGMSVGVPNLAQGNVDPANWAVYRLDQGCGWYRVGEQEISKIIQIV